jgi:hypothetical protein
MTNLSSSSHPISNANLSSRFSFSLFTKTVELLLTPKIVQQRIMNPSFLAFELLLTPKVI